MTCGFEQTPAQKVEDLAELGVMIIPCNMQLEELQS
jgi:hypothetical protein